MRLAISNSVTTYMYKRKISRGWLVPGEWVAVRVDLAVGSIHSPRRNLASSFAFVPLRRACLRSCQPQGSDVLYPSRSGKVARKASLQMPPSPNISNWPSQVSEWKVLKVYRIWAFAKRGRGLSTHRRGFREKMLSPSHVNVFQKWSVGISSLYASLYIYMGRPRLHRALHLFVANFGYRNIPTLYPYLGTFHLSAATCSRYSNRTFQLARSCALGPHKRHEFRVRIWRFWVRQTMERQARLLFAFARSVCPLREGKSRG